jgi:hypothetical protein
MSRVLRDLTGQKFTLLTAAWPTGKDHRNHVHWLFFCSCGSMKVLPMQNVTYKAFPTKSCGCLPDTRRRPKVPHGHARNHKDRPGYGTRTYRSWQSMKQRCLNTRVKEWKYYGGRGITVCEPWKEFKNFLADMGERPIGLTLDRYPDNDGNYEPGNCRWATKKEQTQNSRVVRRKAK